MFLKMLKSNQELNLLKDEIVIKINNSGTCYEVQTCSNRKILISADQVEEITDDFKILVSFGHAIAA